jgi:O-antigen ligase
VSVAVREPAAAAIGRRLAQGTTWVILVWAIALLFSTAVAEILLGLAVALRLAGWAASRGGAPDLRGGPTTRLVPWLLLAFVTLYMLSVVTAVDPHTSARKLPTLFRYAVFLAILSAPPDGRAWAWFFRLQGAVVLVLAAQSAHHLAIGWDRAATPNLHYNTLAQVAGTISLLLFAAAGFGPAERRRERRWLAAGAFLAAVLLLLTLSRAAWMGWLSAAAVLVLLLRAHWRWLMPVALGLVAIGVLALPAARHRAEGMTNVADDPEFTRRYDLWAMAEHIIRDRPLTGIGPGGIGVIYDRYKTGVLVDDPQRWPHVHNDLLEIALSHGVAAAAVWVALIVAVYAALVRQLRGWARLPGSWAKSAFVGAALSFHLFTVCGLLHDNYVIYIKINLLLLLLGLMIVADRELAAEAA